MEGSAFSIQFLAGMWYAFFFAPESSIVVCVFRIAFALLLLVFISLTSLHQRNPFVLHSGDTILRLFSLLLAFAPVGAMLSVDAWVSGTVASDSPPWALRLMQVLMATIYLRSLGWKLRGRWWREGSAVYWALTAAGSTESGRCRRLRHPLHLGELLAKFCQSFLLVGDRFHDGIHRRIAKLALARKLQCGFPELLARLLRADEVDPGGTDPQCERRQEASGVKGAGQKGAGDLDRALDLDRQAAAHVDGD